MSELHRRPPRLAATLALATLLALGSAPARAGSGQALGAPADSATRTTWTLSNGTRVVAQHIPDGFAIAISVSYPGGTDQDPADRGGLAALLAELQFTAAAGEVPDRTRSEMRSLRPMGADIHVGRCFTILTEVASRAQFHGVLHQVAARMHGVQVSPKELAAAIATVRERYQGQFLREVDVALHNEVGERARGTDDASLRRLAAVAGLDRLTPQDVAPLLAKSFSPRHALITIAGNLEGLDLRAALEHELAALPGGAPGALPPIRSQRAVTTLVRRAGLERPVGVLGIFAPALSDSSHPAFFLASLIIGAQANIQWGEPVAPLRARFQYSVLEDPDLLRLYPPMALTDRTGEALAESFNSTIGRQDNLVVSDDIAADLRYGVGWLLGAPLNDRALNHMRTESTALILLSTSLAEGELRGGEPFWSVYRARAEHVGVPDLVYWLGYMRDPKLQARLVYLPAERKAEAGH